MLPTDRALDLAKGVLAGVQAAYAAAGVALPARQYVADGAIAWDCDQGHLAVQAVGIFANQPLVDGPALFECGVTYSGVYLVSLVRCAPGGDKATRPEAAIEASAAVVLADPMLIFNGLVKAMQDGTLVTGGLVWDRWTSRGPEGLLVGGDLQVRLSLLDG